MIRSSFRDPFIFNLYPIAIRASIEPGETGAITEADVMTALPFSIS